MSNGIEFVDTAVEFIHGDVEWVAKRYLLTLSDIVDFFDKFKLNCPTSVLKYIRLDDVTIRANVEISIGSVVLKYTRK